MWWIGRPNEKTAGEPFGFPTVAGDKASFRETRLTVDRRSTFYAGDGVGHVSTSRRHP